LGDGLDEREKYLRRFPRRVYIRNKVQLWTRGQEWFFWLGDKKSFYNKEKFLKLLCAADKA
jgi:hypothetical protein